MNTATLTAHNNIYHEVFASALDICKLEYQEDCSLEDVTEKHETHAKAWSDANSSYFNARLSYFLFETIKSNKLDPDAKNGGKRGGGGIGSKLPPMANKGRIRSHDVATDDEPNDNNTYDAKYNLFLQQLREKRGDYQKIFSEQKIEIRPLTIPAQNREMTEQERQEKALFWITNDARGGPAIGGSYAVTKLTLETLHTEQGIATIEAYRTAANEHYIKSGELHANILYSGSIRQLTKAKELFEKTDEILCSIYRKSPAILEELEDNLMLLTDAAQKIAVINRYSKRAYELLEDVKKPILELIVQVGGGTIPIDEKFIFREYNAPAWSNKYYYRLFIKIAFVCCQLIHEFNKIREAQGIANTINKPLEPTLFNQPTAPAINITVNTLQQSKQEVTQIVNNTPADQGGDKPKKLTPKQEIKTKSLRQIWEGTEQEYKAAILFLQRPFTERDIPIITEENGKLILSRTIAAPKKYLSTFLWLCANKGLIKKDYSLRELVSICHNTFTIESFNKSSLIDLYLEPGKEAEPYVMALKPFFDGIKNR